MAIQPIIKLQTYRLSELQQRANIFIKVSCRGAAIVENIFEGKQ
jgi:hypothetical protein